ncbi:hybrid sensor histidine kinase/response regulator [Herbaspirillum seropedicae]|uniref:hybrid sensor histidine kinase/response regulator n=1 Tax=Herbaspirillum seropedicae TaxID=964 RepID=UPI003FCC298F
MPASQELRRAHGPALRMMRALLLTLALGLVHAPHAGALSIDFAQVGEAATITSALWLLHDPGAHLGVQEARAQPDWRPVGVSVLKLGYDEGAYWLYGTLRNSAEVPATRWLGLGSARLEDVQLHLLDTDHGGDASAAAQMQQAGTRFPLGQRSVRSLRPFFTVTLAPGEERQFMLRVASDSIIDISVALWEPAAMRQEEGRELAIQGFLLGLSLLLAAYALVQGLVWRDRSLMLMAAWLVTAQAYICAFQGYLYRYLLEAGSPWIVHAPATLGCLATLIYLRMSQSLVELERLWRWKTLYRCMILALGAVTLWTALGDYRDAAPVANASAGLSYLAWLASMLHAWRRRLDNARMLVLSFALAWLAMSMKMLELNGVFDGDLLPDWRFAALFQIGLLCMTSVIVTGRAVDLHRKHEQMQWTMLYLRVREQLKLEKAVAARTQELRQALQAADEANLAKSGFLTRISHDLRTPLTSILGFADMIQASGGPHAGHGRIIIRSARHMLAMVNDLIDYARGDPLDTPQPAPLYLHALLQEIAQEGQVLAQRQHNHFTLDISPDLPPVLALDARRLHRILGNLLDNAAKYTREGRIGLRVQWQADHADAGKGALQIEVSDTGCGIAPQFQARIFEPFERADADRRQPGIGMGLAIVRLWVQRMGGSIALESQPGVGTRMRLQLPAELGSEQDIASHHVQEHSSARMLIDGAGRQVVVVEDSPEIARLLSDQLSSLGFAVSVFGDGETAIAHLSALTMDQDAPALVLTDYLLPGVHGGVVLQAARRLLPEAPVLLLSATLHACEVELEGDLRFDGSLLKPVNFSELQEMIAQLLQLPLQGCTGSADSTAGEVVVTPPEALLQAALGLIAEGAVSDLIDWCETLGHEHPQCSQFQAQALEHITQGHLARLRAMCEQALSAHTESAAI